MDRGCCPFCSGLTDCWHGRALIRIGIQSSRCKSIHYDSTNWWEVCCDLLFLQISGCPNAEPFPLSSVHAANGLWNRCLSVCRVDLKPLQCFNGQVGQTGRPTLSTATPTTRLRWRGVNSTLSKASLVGVIYSLLSSPTSLLFCRSFEWATIRVKRDPKNVCKIQI